MTKKLVSFDDQAEPGEGLPAAVKAELNATYGFKGVQQVAPTLHAYEMKAQGQRRALTLTADGTVYTINQNSLLIQKSDDFGTTWTDRGTVPFDPRVMARSHVSGTMLAIENAQPCRIGRSTDDGQTWTVLGSTFNFPPLSEQGLVCTGSGHWMVGEYGNVGNTVYRIMRSTDDGLSFTAVYSSSGQDPTNDPGHIHSVSYDHVADTYVAFSDRLATGTAGPKLLKSTDEGATWQIIGEAKNEWDPNFVAPMYFDNYVAWGYDNHRNGVISRMKRADFYSGNWTRETIEDVAQLNDKVFYSTFPVRDGVWAIAQAVEKITDSAIKDPGSFAQEVHLVSGDGAIVSGGFQFHGSPHSVTVPLSARARFPSYDHGALDHGRFAWVNVDTGYPYTYAAVPMTVGIGPTLPKIEAAHLTPPIMVPGSAIRGRGGDGALYNLFEFDAYRQVVLRNGVSTATNPVRAILTEAGSWEIMSGPTLLMALSPDGVVLRSGHAKIGSTSGPSLHALDSDPNGALAAPKGSLSFSPGGTDNGTLWVKAAGGSNSTGWARLAVNLSGQTSSRPTARPTGTQYFDTQIGKPVWWSGTAWVDATGTAA